MGASTSFLPVQKTARFSPACKRAVFSLIKDISMSDCKYVKVITTLRGHYRSRGVTHNFPELDDVTVFVGKLENCDLKSVKQIRIVPTEITFTSPRDAAAAIDGASGKDDCYDW
jgi:hypothetical protein